MRVFSPRGRPTFRKDSRAKVLLVAVGSPPLVDLVQGSNLQVTAVNPKRPAIAVDSFSFPFPKKENGKLFKYPDMGRSIPV